MYQRCKHFYICI